MISKELLSEVLGVSVLDIVNDRYTPSNTLQFEIKKRMLDNSGIAVREINIYELAHECKVYAAERSYSLESSVHMKPKRSSVAGCQVHWRYESEDLPYFEADSEPEAVLKAFAWVLSNEETRK